MKRSFCGFALSLLLFSMPNAEVQSGTLIVFYFSKDQIAVAADSRGLFIGTDRPPDDTQCKVATINGQVLFASSGGTEFNPRYSLGPVRSWDNIAEARRSYEGIYSNTVGEHTLRMVADAWGTTMVSNWQSLYFVNKRLVQQTAERQNGYLTQALWGGFDTAKSVTLFLTEIALDDASIKPISYRIRRINSCPHELCILGRGELAKELLLGATDRAKAEIANWKPSPSYDPKFRELLRAVRLIDLTIASGDERTVGGEIDAVQLSSDGSVLWLARKNNCQAD